MNKKYQNFLSVSWEHVLTSEEDIIKLLEELKLQNFKDIQIVSRTYTQDNRLVMLISANNKKNQPLNIIIDATSEIPIWEQFINGICDQGSANDIKIIKIILYGKDYNDPSYNFPACEILNLNKWVRCNNKCNIKPYLVKNVVADYNGQKALRRVCI